MLVLLVVELFMTRIIDCPQYLGVNPHSYQRNKHHYHFPRIRGLFYQCFRTTSKHTGFSVLTEVIRLAQRGLMVLSGCPRTYGGYSTKFRDLTYSRLFSPYTRGFLGGLNNLTLNSTLFLQIWRHYLYIRKEIHICS